MPQVWYAMSDGVGFEQVMKRFFVAPNPRAAAWNERARPARQNLHGQIYMGFTPKLHGAPPLRGR